MSEPSGKSSVSLAVRQKLLNAFPCFATLTETERKELSSLMIEVHYLPLEQIVLENELVDSIYIIVSGEAEVSRKSIYRRKTVKTPIAVLRSGESIGLNDTGFYSPSGKRTATVNALSEMLLLKLDLKVLYSFLKQHQLELSMYAASAQMLRMLFIKQSLPFAKISHERLRWLAEHVEEIAIPAGTIIFRQGEVGDKCYLIRTGEIEIIAVDENNNEHQLALLKPPVIFGEATLITHTPRNATARATKDSECLILKHEHLSELIESENNVANMFMTLMVDRSRPIQNSRISIHHRTAADGQEITILKNPDTGSYFKLSNEGAYIWHQLDGEHTMQEITLKLAEQYQVFAPDVVAALISKLTKAGFIKNLEISDDLKLSSKPLWVRAMVKLRHVLESRFAFGDADKWMSKIYEKYIHYFFTRPGQVFLGIIGIVGILAFVSQTPHILNFFSEKRANLLLLLVLVPFSVIELLFHEFAHAFAVKAYGREVHYIGVGWYWFGPIAFTDTSDMWLSPRRPRMIVNFAGIYMDLLMAGVAAIFIMLIPNYYIQAMLWLCAFYTYIGAFRMLSPLQEMDGYYILMDWVEKNRLREAAVVWLIKEFPKCLRRPKLCLYYKPELVYWLACLFYLVLVTIMTLTVVNFVFKIIGMQSNPYISLLVPFIVVIFSCLSIIAELRSQAEE